MSSPQEKAIELVSAYARIDGYVDSIDLSKCEFEKKCALIMVDELLTNSTFLLSNGELYFWNEVKKEIEKL